MTSAGPEPRPDAREGAAPARRPPVFHVFEEIYRRARGLGREPAGRHAGPQGPARAGLAAPAQNGGRS